MVDAGYKPDMLFIDGRLAAEDLRLLAALDPRSTIYVLDDFEGIEKGVENCIALRRAFPDLILIRPHISEGDRLLNTAILLPPSIILETAVGEVQLLGNAGSIGV